MKWKLKDPKELWASYQVKIQVDHIHFLIKACAHFKQASPLMVKFKLAHNIVFDYNKSSQ